MQLDVMNECVIDTMLMAFTAEPTLMDELHWQTWHFLALNLYLFRIQAWSVVHIDRKPSFNHTLCWTWSAFLLTLFVIKEGLLFVVYWWVGGWGDYFVGLVFFFKVFFPMVRGCGVREALWADMSAVTTCSQILSRGLLRGLMSSVEILSHIYNFPKVLCGILHIPVIIMYGWGK